jgi:hypothetical protein
VPDFNQAIFFALMQANQRGSIFVLLTLARKIMEVISMYYDCNIERDFAPLNTDSAADIDPKISSGNSSKKTIFNVENLTCNYLYDGLQPLGCEHCHACDSW